MAFDYSGLAAKASRILVRFGAPVTIGRAVTSGDAWRPNVTRQETEANGVRTSYLDDEIDGTSVQAGDVRFILDSEVIVGDTITDAGGSVWRAVNVNKIAPNATDAVIHIAQARK
jgi:hypothetical protein